MHFSNHGFFAANILLNIVCVVVFFVVVQQVPADPAKALARLIGWTLWPG